jgi:hypothetical protein
VLKGGYAESVSGTRSDPRRVETLQPLDRGDRQSWITLSRPRFAANQRELQKAILITRYAEARRACGSHVNPCRSCTGLLDTATSTMTR